MPLLDDLDLVDQARVASIAAAAVVRSLRRHHRDALADDLLEVATWLADLANDLQHHMEANR